MPCLVIADGGLLIANGFQLGIIVIGLTLK